MSDRVLRVLFVVSVGSLKDDVMLALGRGLARTGVVSQIVVVHSSEQAREVAAAASAWDRVVAVGGDGTVGKVAAGLCEIPADNRPEMALLPGGTANDFAGGIGLLEMTLEDTMTLALCGTACRTDMAATGKRHFINFLTLGFPAELSDDTPRELKDAVGGLAYPIHGLANLGSWQALDIEVQADDFSWSGRALAVCICNGSQAGGGIVMAPEASLDDGLLDLVIVPQVGAEMLPAAVSRLFDHESRPDWVIAVRTTQVSVRSATKFAASADGEVIWREFVDARVLPSELRVARPD